MRSAGDRLWVGIKGPTIVAQEWDHLEAVAPGGIILFRRNIEDTSQAKDLVAELQDRLGPQTHVVVDQEGGAVVRFENECTVLPGNLALGAVARVDRDRGLTLAREAGRVSGSELHALGLTGNLAPVCDLTTRVDNPGVGCRSFGGDPGEVGDLAAEFVRGHLEAGVFAVLKHFPGLGGADLDSHEALPHVEGVDVAQHLEPFARGIAAGAPVVMTAHLVHEMIDPDYPATASEKVVRLLRGRMGFSGVVMTDDLEMSAITDRPVEERVERALLSGHDILCFCHDQEQQARARATLDQLEAGNDPIVSHRLDALAQQSLEEFLKPDGEDVARTIAESGVTVLRIGEAPTVIPDQERWLLITPHQRHLSPAEDPLRAEDLSALADELGERVHRLEVAAEPTSEEIDRASKAAADYDAVAVATIGLRDSPARRDLLLKVLKENSRLLAILLGDPGELSSIQGRDFTAMTAYGYRRPHQRALGRVLRGEIEALGRWPVSDSLLPDAYLTAE